MGRNGPKVASTSTSEAKASTSMLKSSKDTTSGINGRKKVSKGKKFATPKIVDNYYSVVEDVKKDKTNIFVFDLSKISS